MTNEEIKALVGEPVAEVKWAAGIPNTITEVVLNDWEQGKLGNKFYSADQLLAACKSLEKEIVQHRSYISQVEHLLRQEVIILQKQLVGALVENQIMQKAIKANDEWHRDYDEEYQCSELQDQNEAAIAIPLTREVVLDELLKKALCLGAEHAFCSAGLNQGLTLCDEEIDKLLKELKND